MHKQPKTYWWLEEGVPTPVARAADREHANRNHLPHSHQEDASEIHNDEQMLAYWRALREQCHSRYQNTTPRGTP